MTTTTESADVPEPNFPANAEQLTAGWVEQKLRATGKLEGAGLANIEVRPFGTGQVGESVRISIAYKPGSSGPDTLVAKFASNDADSRKTSASLGVYEREVRFYREIVHKLGVRSARTIATELDPSGSYFVLLFEDLAPARSGNQLASCELPDALHAMRQAAAIHAPSILDPNIQNQTWLITSPEVQQYYLETYPKCHEIFREHYKDRLDPELIKVADRFCDNIEAWHRRTYNRMGLVHGDFRLDNMLFDIKGGREPIAVVDWQTLSLADPLIDVGYFLGTGIGSELRRPNERLLLETYCEEMTARGVPMTVESIWDDYCIGALQGLWMGVFCTALVKRTERGDLNFLSMSRGAAELALDNDSVSALIRHCERTKSA